MRSLSKPTETSQEVFQLCIDGVANLDQKKHYLTIKGDIRVAGEAYEAAAVAGSLHMIPAVDKIGGVVTAKEMSWLYDNEMVRGPGRALYEKLRSAPEWNECPLCGQRVVSTLDHHLPQSKFPAYAVNAQNLVPCCLDCNKAKLAESAGSAEDQTIHPYYDDFDRDEWLVAEVVEKAPPALRFSVRPPAHWSELQRKRAVRHVKVFGLRGLYATHAAQELVNIRGHLVELSTGPGVDAVRNYLFAQAKSRRCAYLNSWQTAMYAALSANNWFCIQGFHEIPAPKRHAHS